MFNLLGKVFTLVGIVGVSLMGLITLIMFPGWITFGVFAFVIYLLAQDL